MLTAETPGVAVTDSRGIDDSWAGTIHHTVNEEDAAGLQQAFNTNRGCGCGENPPITPSATGQTGAR